ncbi:MAG: hypothetical protein A2Z24_00995 [Candidatus Woykebacteria bacterium RBG_16_44_10]|uniref:Uncharacterized protein n=1 Tax=Candidatus Woykebacteria bacterium RBG_16_44_10 TaxID=1802597 RepID=A0A1G1WDC7_9BACT|nr:MAG: hypothetical protein A2Z24_00995 [Candidatus Woykebacteria bacterium RBG_16_44_10]
MAKEIVLDIKPKESAINKIKPQLPWIGAAVLIAAAIFTIGFAIGKLTDFEVPLFEGKTATKSATRAGWFVRQTSKFSLEYPSGWEVKINPKDAPAGAKIATDGAKVEFWITDVKAYKFTKEQTSQQKGVKETKLKIDGRSAYVKKFIYKEGDIFAVTELTASEKKPKVIFWAHAADADFEKTASEIISTFKGKKILKTETETK